MLGSLNSSYFALQGAVVSLSRLTLIMAMLLLLAACSEQHMGDLQNYVSDVKGLKGKIDPLPVFEQIPQFAYHSDDMKDPFSTWKTEVAPIAKSNTSGLYPDAQREREELEAYPLDTLRMMGVIEMKNVRWGLVKDSDGIVHRVKAGNYMGQNFGKIASVDSESIMLVEIVPNGLGGWERREASLTLNIE